MNNIKHYKEIFFGALLGVCVWLLDVMMHAQMASDGHDLQRELFAPGATALLFRTLFLVVAVSFGFALWRANWRERELKATEKAITSFQRKLDLPTMRILSHARMLQGRLSVIHDDVAAELVNSINDDARMIDELTRAYSRFGEQVRNGQMTQAVETLRLIEAYKRDGNASLS